jgi:hypothetical protein
MQHGIARLVLGLAVAATAAFAHHSFAAEFDGNAPITIKGKINHVDWVNPHSWVHVDVVGPDGKVTTWRCETAPPNGLIRRGWSKKSIPPGMEVTVEGFRAKDGSPTMNARSVLLPDGKRMFAGSSGDGAPVREGDPKQ